MGDFVDGLSPKLSKAQRKRAIMDRLQEDLKKSEDQLQELQAKPWFVGS